ncbi:MAG TPA: Gfo/Idh/MocA family oxidoreductase [Candidatus Atribacteria bacterium]|nr:Gfo/Idh/MocA family oxidoreductase [Candidatus Atribacteria bacterium]
MKKTLNFAVLGCGSIAKIAHLPSIEKTEGAQLVAVCDINEKTVKSTAQKWGAKYWFTDYKEMFKKCDELDAVIIATPNNVHRNQAVAAAKAGLHIVVEKPLAVTNFEAWDIVNACKKYKVKLMVGCDRRFWTQNKWAKELLEQGVIGKVLMARSSLHEHWHLYQNNVAETDFRLRAEVAGGAALPDTGAHAIDLLTWLMNSRVKRVTGIAKRLAFPESYTKCDDTVWVLLEMENNSYGCISCNRFSPVSANVTELYGTEGTIYTSTDGTNPFQSVPMAVFTNKDYNFEDLPGIIKNYRWPQKFWVEDMINRPVEKRWVPIIPPKYPNNYENMTKHFMDCLIDDKKPLVSGEDGARAIEVMCAVYKSMETDSWVELPLKEEVIPPYYKPLIKENI